MLTVKSARPKDIWPDGSGHTREIEDEIIRCAREEITAADVARSGLGFAAWYIPFVLAEHRVLERHKQRAEAQAQAKNAQEAAARAAAAKAKYPPAEAWAKPIKYVRVLKGDSERDRACEDFRKRWFAESRALPVFRRDVSAHAGMSINDGRKLYRDLLVTMAESDCLASFIVREANERIVKLEKRIEELKARKIPTYKGVWQENELYKTSDLVTYGGSCWYCKHETMGKPSTTHDAWQLCVKAGRDGKSVR